MIRSHQPKNVNCDNNKYQIFLRCGKVSKMRIGITKHKDIIKANGFAVILDFSAQCVNGFTGCGNYQSVLAILCQTNTGKFGCRFNPLNVSSTEIGNVHWNPNEYPNGNSKTFVDKKCKYQWGHPWCNCKMVCKKTCTTYFSKRCNVKFKLVLPKSTMREETASSNSGLVTMEAEVSSTALAKILEPSHSY